MKIVEQSFEILTNINGEDVLKHLENCGRICYQSHDLTTEDSYKRFIKGIVTRHHESVLEHYSVSVKFVTDRAIANELVRHRLASYSQESSRYCSYDKDKFGNEIKVVKPIEIDENSVQYVIWRDACHHAEKEYFNLLHNGVKAENARAVLPLCLATQIVCTANLREWLHIFKMRCDKSAHPDIRDIMRKLAKEFQKQIPIIFDEIVTDEGN